MAIRVHVVGALDTSQAELSEALGAAGAGAPAGAGDGWAWMRLSARGASASAIDAALDALDSTSLRTTTVDGALWELRLAAPGRDPWLGAHHFLLLDPDDLFLEDDEDMAAFAAERDIPAGLVEHPAAPVDAEAVGGLARRHAEELLERLADFDIPHDPDEVRAILTGASVTEHELGWDVGNLPRFLEALGLGDAVEGWRDDLAEDEALAAGNEAALAELRADPLAGLRARVGDVTAAPLEAGPLALSVDELFLLLDLAEKCATGFALGISVDAEGNDAVRRGVDAADGPFVGVVHSRIEILIDDWARLWNVTRAVLPALAGARDGAALEVMTGRVHGEGGEAATQRYLGRLEGGAFLIEASYPAMAADTLAAALELMRAERAEALEVLDEAEGEALVAEVTDEIWFFGGPPTITLDGHRLDIEPAHAVEGVAQYLFNRRFGSTWDVRRRAEWHRQQVQAG